MDPSELIVRYPVVWHMAESGSFPQIRRHGLLSTTAILDLYEVDGEKRHLLERCRRPESHDLSKPGLGRMTVRDQKPLSEKLLMRCLTGMTAEEWYMTLNRRVFFWVSKRRLERLLCARAYRDRTHTILAVRTSDLVASHESAITLARINTGAIHPGSLAVRGAGTFVRVSEYPSTELSRIVEVAVDYSVPDIDTMIDGVERKRCER